MANPKFRVIQYAYLDYDGQTANFNVGQTLTGAISEATANIFADDDQGTTGQLTIGEVTEGFGSFQNNESITDDGGTPGAAVANGVIQYVEYVWDTLNLQPAAPVSAGRDFMTFENELREPTGKLLGLANEKDLRVYDAEWDIDEAQVRELIKWFDRSIFWLYPDADALNRLKVRWVEDEFQPEWLKGGRYRLNATLQEVVL